MKTKEGSAKSTQRRESPYEEHQRNLHLVYEVNVGPATIQYTMNGAHNKKSQSTESAKIAPAHGLSEERAKLPPQA